MSQRLIIKNIIVFLLVLLWVYAAASKLIDFNIFKVQMHRQILPAFAKTSLLYILPGLEIAAALLLLFDKSQLAGFVISLGLMAAFTVYVGLAVFRIFDQVPCSCGGVINKLGWDGHFIFNIFFTLLAAIGFYISFRERRLKENL
jgi:putative oxidoreductase